MWTFLRLLYLLVALVLLPVPAMAFNAKLIPPAACSHVENHSDSCQHNQSAPSHNPLSHGSCCQAALGDLPVHTPVGLVLASAPQTSASCACMSSHIPPHPERPPQA